MTMWMVRAGRVGEQEDLALEKSLAVIGWHDIPDMSGVDSREALYALWDTVWPDSSKGQRANEVGQLWAFLGRISVGDLVILPQKKRSAVAVGRVVGNYEYRPDLDPITHHVRKVEWLRTDIPRNSFDQDILYSLGAFMTVCQIKRNNAEERVKAMLEGRRIEPPSTLSDSDETEAEDAGVVDLEGYARDLIRRHLGQKFKGQLLEQLVTAVLTAQGYTAQSAPAGADGGVDIIAGRGSMGFDSPRLVVQVKSSDQPQDVKVLRELQGVMTNFGAEQGLLVAWGGFKRSVDKESRRLFFQVRLWDADDLVDALLKDYDRLPEDLQAEIPLKRIWALVPDED